MGSLVKMTYRKVVIMAFSAKFTNYSGVDWQRSSYSWSKKVLEDQIASEPKPTLNNNDSTSMALDSNVLEILAAGNCEIECCWQNQEKNLSFGVKLHWPVQILGIGTSPYYLTSKRSWGQDPSWGRPDGSDEAAHVYQFSENGVKVTMTPTASAQSISVDVLIDTA